jgi:dTDP-4-dehydrorhamnose reductase
VIGTAREKGITLKAVAERVEAIATEAYPTPAARPKNSLLNTAKLSTTFGLQMPDWKSGVVRLVDQLTSQGTA